MKKILSLIIAVFFLFSTGGVFAEEVDGETLVRQLWEISAAKKWSEHESLLAPAFQSLHSFGASDKHQELELLKNVNFDKFELTDFRVTRQDNVIIATYRATVTETIRGERLTMKNAPRMTMFIKSDKGWQWLSHAVFASDK